MSPYRARAERWDSRLARLRERVAHVTPRVVVGYPFEVFAASVGLIIGLPLLVGLAAPTSLVVLLPSFIYWVYAVMLVLGAGTTAVGLRTKHPLILAPGLQLLGGSYLVYALATVAVAGWAIAWAAFGCFCALGLVSLVRSSYFRRLIDIQKGASRLRAAGQ